MMPLSHTYVSASVTGSHRPLLIFGSVLPDICTTSKGVISRLLIHNSPQEFLSFIKYKYPELVDLGRGVVLHSSVSRGADYYSDDPEIGFAMLEGKKLLPQVKDLLQTGDEAVALKLAHNFIEAGVDLNLKASHAWVYELYSTAFEKLDLKYISHSLADYLGLNYELVYQEVVSLKFILGPAVFISLDSMITGLAVPLIEARFKTSVDPIGVKEILLESTNITRGNYLGYLNGAVSGIKKAGIVTI